MSSRSAPPSAGSGCSAPCNFWYNATAAAMCKAGTVAPEHPNLPCRRRAAVPCRSAVPCTTAKQLRATVTRADTSGQHCSIRTLRGRVEKVGGQGDEMPIREAGSHISQAVNGRCVRTSNLESEVEEIVVVVVVVYPGRLLLLAAPCRAAEPPCTALHIRCCSLARLPRRRRRPLPRLLRLPSCCTCRLLRRLRLLLR